MHAHHLLELWTDAERPLPDCELFDIFVNIRPMGKERARENWRTPERTRAWETLVRNVATSAMDGRPPIDFPVCAIALWGLHKNRADTDNLEKILWDALQPNTLANDKHVRGYILKVEREERDGGEFVWVRFYARRREDYNNYIGKYNDRDRNSVEYGY